VVDGDPELLLQHPGALLAHADEALLGAVHALPAQVPVHGCGARDGQQHPRRRRQVPPPPPRRRSVVLPLHPLAPRMYSLSRSSSSSPRTMRTMCSRKCAALASHSCRLHHHEQSKAARRGAGKEASTSTTRQGKAGGGSAAWAGASQNRRSFRDFPTATAASK
jgi:hypothetical protein